MVTAASGHSGQRSQRPAIIAASGAGMIKIHSQNSKIHKIVFCQSDEICSVNLGRKTTFLTLSSGQPSQRIMVTAASGHSGLRSQRPAVTAANGHRGQRSQRPAVTAASGHSGQRSQRPAVTTASGHSGQRAARTAGGATTAIRS